MPQRVELTEQTGGSVAGYPFWVARARDKRLVAFVAVIDRDGLLETREEVEAYGKAYLRRVDKRDQKGEDAGG